MLLTCKSRVSHVLVTNWIINITPHSVGAGKKAAPAAKKENKQKQKDSEEITESEMTEEQVDEAVESLLDAEIIAGRNYSFCIVMVQN